MTEAFIGKTHQIFIPNFFYGYKYENTIGHGSFSIVILVTRISDGKEFACKVLSQSFLIENKIVESFKREVEVYQKLDHPNIVKLFEILSDDKLIYMIMEYCSKGNLYNYIAKKGGLPEHTSRHLFKQLISSIKYIHNLSIVHRDLKPENIMLDSSNTIKLADFGFCREIPVNILMTTKCGSPVYTAPEIISTQKYDGKMADMWSLGVILFVLLTGKIPWDAINETQLFFQIQTAHFHIPETISTSASNLISDLMQPQPDMRLSSDLAINHPWLDDFNSSIRSFSTPGSLILQKKIIPEISQRNNKGSVIELPKNHKHRLSMRENPILSRRYLPLTERNNY